MLNETLNGMLGHLNTSSLVTPTFVKFVGLNIGSSKRGLRKARAKKVDLIFSMYNFEKLPHKLKSAASDPNCDKIFLLILNKLSALQFQNCFSHKIRAE